MNLMDAEQLVHSLMEKHGLLNHGWTFKWDNAVRRFGVCRYHRKEIGLSKKLVMINDVDKVKDTILHEIAHAIAGHGAGHGWRWKQVCIQIGAKPERCYSSKEVNVPESNYYAVCGACGVVHERSRARRYPNKRVSCKCQSGIDWDKRVLLEYKKRK